MFSKIVTGAISLALASITLRADFSYQEKSTLTGGAMLSMMKVAGVFSKGAREARGGCKDGCEPRAASFRSAARRVVLSRSS